MGVQVRKQRQLIHEVSARMTETPTQTESPQSSESEASIPLLKFADEANESPAIPSSLNEYVALVEWTGRADSRTPKRWSATDGCPAENDLDVRSLHWVGIHV